MCAKAKNTNSDEPAISAWIDLHRAHRLLIESVESALKAAELPSLDWYDVMLELHRAGDGGLRQFEIGQRVLLNKHNLSRLLDRLESKKYLLRQSCEEDGRGYQVFITEQGTKTLKQMWPVYRDAIEQHFAKKLNQKDFSLLSAILQKLLS